MKPIEFKEQNIVFAKDQPEYVQLPAHRVSDEKGEVIFCMQLSFAERLRLLITGKLWCSLLTFNKPLTPSFFSTQKKDLFTGMQLTAFGRLNYYFLQFFFIRLTRCEQRVITKFDLHSVSIGGGVSGSPAEYHTEYWWSIQYWIIPFTGWTSPFKCIGKATRYLRITKNKSIQK